MWKDMIARAVANSIEGEWSLRAEDVRVVLHVKGPGVNKCW
jgi:hypothetical protein